VLLLTLAVAMRAFAPVPGHASSHREAPLTAANPQIDNTDVYAFVSPDKPSTVTLISNFIPMEEPAGGPNFYPFGQNVHYDIKIDNNGDGTADVIYQWTFTNHHRNPETFLYNTGPVTSLTDPDLNFYQTYNLQRMDSAGRWTTLVKNAIAVPSNVGKASMPDYAALRMQGIRSFEGGAAKVLAGQADDPFFVDLRVFDLLYGANFSEIGDDTLAGFNVNTLALQVPKSDLAKGRNATANPIVGIWSTASRRSIQVTAADSSRGRYVQVSRLANPLVNEVIIGIGDKDRWNRSMPSEEQKFINYYKNPTLPKVVEAVYGITAPATPRNDLVTVFLKGIPKLNQPPHVELAEELRLNMAIPPCQPGSCSKFSRLGVIGGDVAGYPNGRRLQDDVLDIALQVMEGELVGNPNDLGDAVDHNDVPFSNSFPFEALPHSGSNPSPHS
jgi:hypothetical protein